MDKNQSKNEKSRDSSRDSVSHKLISNKNFVKLRYYLEKIKKEYKLTDKEILFELTKELQIPVSLFNETLSGLETISKYLKENLNLNYKTIARLLSRSEKTIWQAHFFSKRKYPQKFSIKETEFFIPVSVLGNRKLSVLESITSYLKDSLGLKFHEIASLLKRDHSTIWTVYHRSKQKTKR